MPAFTTTPDISAETEVSDSECVIGSHNPETKIPPLTNNPMKIKAKASGGAPFKPAKAKELLAL
ncbi:hypothetical protein MTo_02943 [Microcystis aeruginosa NIES-1211]|nr:hypothetical protein MTo_02943 [Microcystis aeruginosa NIES-1211]GCA83157.1 hypothetical protein MiHa_01115 [Microcystis aeruginosa NIES-2522]